MLNALAICAVSTVRNAVWKTGDAGAADPNFLAYGRLEYWYATRAGSDVNGGENVRVHGPYHGRSC